MKSFLKRFNKEFVKITTMRYHNLTLFVFAALSAAGTYAQEQEYATEITEDTQYNAPLTGDTAIKNGATLTLTTSNTGSNYNLLIESGATLVHGVDSTDAFKWGTGSPNSMSAVIENYGTIDMQSNKAFRFGDDGAGYSTTLNLYDGSLMTSSTGTFTIENYRGVNSIINVFKGAQITNLSGINTWGRNNEMSPNGLFEMNVAGGSVDLSGDVNFGNTANADSSIVQTSRLNVTDGGTFTSTKNLNLGNAANNDAYVSVSGEGSTLSVNSIYASRNADATSSVSVSDSGKLITASDVWVGSANGSSASFDVSSGGVWSISGGNIFNAYGEGSTATLNVDGGVISQDSSSSKNLIFGQGASSSSSLNVLNGGQIVENTSTYNMYLAHNTGSTFEGVISGSKLGSEGQTVYSSVNLTGSMVLASGANSSSNLKVSDGGVLNFNGSSANGSLMFAQGSGANASLVVADGGTLNFGSRVQLGNGENSTASLLVEKGGVVNVNVATDVRMGLATGAESTFKIDGGTLNLISPDSDMKIQMGHAAGNSTSNLILTNDALLQQTGKNLQLNMWNGTNTLEISNGAKWAASTNFYVGRNADSVSTMNVDGAYVLGASGTLTSNSSDLHTGAGAGVTSYVNITNGAIANFRGLNVSQGHTNLNTTTVGGANAVSYITVSGNGSVLSVRGTDNKNYHNRLGVNKYDEQGQLNSTYEGNVASLTVHTGSQFLNTQNAIQVFDSGEITFALDSNGIIYSQDYGTAMVKTVNLQLYKSDDTVSNPFVIDGSSLGRMEYASEGDIYEIALMEVSGSISLNGVEQDISGMSDEAIQDFVSSLFSFENNTGSDYWEDFDASNVSYNGGTFYISLTYVPEPSTIAAIFGALALAFAAYRRRK